MADTTAELIQRVRDKETIPNSGAAYSDATILDLMDQSLKGFIAPEMEALNEEYFVVTMDFQMANQSPSLGMTLPTNVGNVIDIPWNAMGMRIRDVQIIGSDGTPYSLQRITLTQAAMQATQVPWGSGISPFNPNQSIGGFYLQGNQLELFPYGLASGKLVRVFFQRAPNDLCLTSTSGQVISVTGDVVQINNSPGWTTGTHVCAVSGYNPHDFCRDLSVPTVVYTSYPVLSDVPLVAVAGNILTFPTGMAAGVSAGDWICSAGQSVFAMNIPKEMLPCLVQKTAEAVLEAAGDRVGVAAALSTYNTLIDLARKSLSPRVIGKPIKLLPLNSVFKASRGTRLGRY